jgi:hypothetical protein
MTRTAHALALAALAVAAPAPTPAQSPSMRGTVIELRFSAEDPLPLEARRASTLAIRSCARHAPSPTHGDTVDEVLTGRVGEDGRLTDLRPERAATSPLDRRRHRCLARTLARVRLPRRRPPAELRLHIQWTYDMGDDLSPGVYE